MVDPRVFISSLITVLLSSACLQSTELKFNDQNAAVASGRVPASIVEDYTLELPVSKRHYVASVFSQVFAIQEISTDGDNLRAEIFFKKEFGGSCDPYGRSELVVNGTAVDEFLAARCGSGITADLRATTNPMRYAWTAKACENNIINRPARFAAAMNQILTGWTPGSLQVQHKPNAENLKKAYGLFFQSREPDEEIIAALIQLGSKGATNDEAWKLILISLCVNPEWQSLI
jgi:hypothetical protein